jgi:hypothetical protein
VSAKCNIARHLCYFCPKISMLGGVRVFKFGLEVKFICGLGNASVAQDHAQALTIPDKPDGSRRRADHRERGGTADAPAGPTYSPILVSKPPGLTGMT